MRALAGASAILLLLCACGSSSHGGAVSPRAYMQSVCSALGPWESQLRARSSALTPAAGATAAQRKQDAQKFLNAVITDTDTALSRLKQAGYPDVRGGAKLAGDLVGAFAQLKAAYQRAAQQAAGLPTNSVSSLQNAIAGISTTVDNSLGNVGSRLGALNTPALRQAQTKAPACAKLAAG